FTRVLEDLAHDHGLKVLVATRGAEALALARQYRPMAISLDVFLPDMLGWTVLSQIKQDPATRHIPVQMLTLDEDRQHGLARGAFSFINKPTTPAGLQEALDRITEFTRPHRKQLLLVKDDDIDIVGVGTGEEAIARMTASVPDCVVLDLRLPDMSGFDILEKVKADS